MTVDTSQSNGSTLSQELIDQLLERGICYFTADDVTRLFRQNGYLKSLIIKRLYSIAMLSILFFVLTAMLAYRLVNPLIGNFVTYDPNGEIRRLTPSINKPVTAKNAYEFATQKLQVVRTMFFISYWKDLKHQEELFTADAFNAYLSYLDESGMLYRIRDEHINVTATLSPTQEIGAYKSHEGDSVFWFIKVSLLLRIEQESGIDGLSRESFLVKLIEVDRDESKFGLKIASLEPF